MSGIVGTYHRSGTPVDPDVLRRMTARIGHRGPDGIRHWYDGPVGLGHCMLHTTPESLREPLPYQSRQSGCVITADARIDNRDELIRVLQLRSNGPDAHPGMPDSMLILRAYEKWGEDCVDHLIGAFAFVIWDESRQELFCARDHMGVRPFYYCATERAFVFGSEIKALLAHPATSGEVNEVRIADYLTRTLEDKEATIYTSIRRLPPAHTLQVGASGAQMCAYWDLDTSRTIKFDSQQAYIEAFNDVFEEAVRCRLRSAYPVATHLSGGLDSSAITCVARDLLDENDLPLTTYSALFDHAPDSDEREYIQAVVDQDKLDPRFVHINETGPLTWKNFLLEYEDEPFASSNYFLTCEINAVASSEGTRVLLDGIDGDTTVCHGEYYFDELAYRRQWDELCRTLQEHVEIQPHFSVNKCIQTHVGPALEELARSGHWVSFMRAVGKMGTKLGVSRKRLVLDHFIKAVLPQQGSIGRIRKQLTALLGRNGSREEEEEALINADFAAKTQIWKRHREQTEVYEAPIRSCRIAHRLELAAGIVQVALETLDRMAAAHGIEMRHPFMDKRLVEFCLALPGVCKRNQGFDRWIMRAALRGSLPDAICGRRDKANMHDNLNRAMTVVEKDELKSLVSRDTALMRSYVDGERLRQVYNRIADGVPQASDYARLWHAIHIILWLQHHLPETTSDTRSFRQAVVC